MRIVWGQQYELGIPLIDQQHKRIVDLINDLDRLAGQADAQLGVARVLYDLVDYTASHFSFEEALMQHAGYDALDDHHHLHQLFTGHIESLMRRHGAGEQIAEPLLHLLENWLLHHILEEDRAYLNQVQAFINSIGREQLGAWVTNNLRKHFRMV